MGRTALDLTSEEWKTFRPQRDVNEEQLVERWERAWEVARDAAQLLRRQFGASHVVVFGSLVHRDWFTKWSDIDVAVWGISAEHFYEAVATITGIGTDFEVNLVDPRDCRPTLRQKIEQEGIEL